MSTVSFERAFVVKNEDSSKRLLDDLDKPVQVRVVTRDLKSDSQKGIKLLKQRFSRSVKS